ncbi:MAG TPA: autotransporter domain-containing protein, partial [Xanthobacteraceae bacterium]|nr:autotransporter domain-containing protein [Xanthobacteraceae bacterium]
FGVFNVVSGFWTVSKVFGQSDAWNVNGGTLAGTGTLADLNVNAGGTLQPGTTPGTAMKINGNLAFQSGALYVVTLNGTASTLAKVSGTASLAGGVQALLQPGVTKQTYTILHSGGLGGTTFDSLTVAPGFTGTLTYTPTDVLLGLNANLGLGGNLNINQQNVANALNNFFNAGGALPAGFLPVFNFTGANLQNALTQLSGEANVDGQAVTFQQMTQFLTLMLDPFVAGRNGIGGGAGALGFAPEQEANFPSDIALAYNAILKAPPPKPATLDQRWTAWGTAYGGSDKTNGDPVVGSNTFTANTFGFAAGMDYHPVPDTILGFALAGGGTNWTLAQALGSGRGDAFQAGVYGTKYFGPAYVAASLAVANNWMTTNRTALGDQLTSSFSAQSVGGRVEAGYRYAVQPAIGFTPYGALQAQSFHIPSRTETDLTGGGFGLSFAAMSATDTRSELGARFDGLTTLNGLPLILRGRLAWAHDWVSDPALSAVFQALPGASFVVNGAPLPANSALASAGAELKLNPHVSLLGKFDGEFANGSQTYAGTGTLRYTW